MSVKVSVIIPVYNVELYIKECIKSVLDQSLSDFEVILIDDCSQDNSIVLAKEFISSFQRPNVNIVFLYHPENKGQSAARNTGIKAASGKYLFFLDSDDTISMDCLETLYADCERENTEMCVGENYMVYDKSYKYIELGLKNTEVLYGRKNVMNSFLYGGWHGAPWNKIIRRDFVLANQLFFLEGYVFEDILWNFMLSTKLCSLSVVHKPTYNYFIRNGSTMNTRWQGENHWKDYLRIMPFLKNYIYKEGLKDNLEVSKWYFFQLLTIEQGLSKLDKCDKVLFFRINNLNYVNLNILYSNGMITLKQLIAWYYLNMNNILGYLYYSCFSFYSKCKSKLIFKFSFRALL